MLMYIRTIIYMATVTISLPNHTYNVCIELGALNNFSKILKEHFKEQLSAQTCGLVFDAHLQSLSTVKPNYVEQVITSLNQSDFNVVSVPFQATETTKTLSSVASICDALLDGKLERTSPVISLGGGITGDTTGYVASSLLRGVPFIQCPTTLLSMVDASVGGKVGVNTRHGKNLLGAFYQPEMVIIDPSVLISLSSRDLRCGVAECIKHGLLSGRKLFDWLQKNVGNLSKIDNSTLEFTKDLIQRNVSFKASVVTQDEKEHGIRATLNLGHTFAHAIETITGYDSFNHGEAVALGCVAASWLSYKIGNISKAIYEEIVELFALSGLPTNTELPSVDLLMESMTHDKKVQNKSIRLILLHDIGKPYITSQTPTELVKDAWKAIGAK